MPAPEGYKKLAAGVLCRCPKLYREYGDAYCCQGDWGPPVAPTALTATRLLEMDSRARIARTMHRLLDRLRPYMRAYTRTSDTEMPEHDLVWVEGIDSDGPGQTLLTALKEHPELWVQALPSDCCIVPRALLEKVCGDMAAESLVLHGENIVLGNAARARHEAEEAELRRR
jgi:molybdopterin-guanine dinucleotide biosynthesis protein A